ncbi:MAG: NAD(P)-dependent alcohol dehydrogenase [Chitinophagaceae bacterium]|nr:NAD(P)-dependent alcohol dehydrogenase [Chitinophagaceae bacterium]
MKAAVHTRYGPPDVVCVKDVPKPVCKAGTILIKVHTTTVNRTDCGFRSAEYFISRFWSGLFKPKHQILGCEFAGVVESVAPDVTSFKAGQRVFGYNDQQFGGHAEYTLQSEKGIIAEIPEGVDFIQAAAIAEGAHYALGMLRAANVHSGQQVMVYGATGAIGSAAVQLLKYFGATVTAFANKMNISLIASLGADRVFDYEKTDIKNLNENFDFVFDAVGKLSFTQCRPLLKSRGIYISTELGKYGDNVWRGMISPFYKGKKVLFPLPSFSRYDIELLAALVSEGKFKPVIDRTYKLNEIREAYVYVETGQKTGNVVIEV